MVGTSSGLVFSGGVRFGAEAVSSQQPAARIDEPKSPPTPAILDTRTGKIVSQPYAEPPQEKKPSLLLKSLAVVKTIAKRGAASLQVRAASLVATIFPEKPKTLENLYSALDKEFAKIPMTPAEDVVEKMFPILLQTEALAPKDPRNLIKLGDYYSKISMYKKQLEVTTVKGQTESAFVDLRKSAIEAYDRALSLGFQDNSGTVANSLARLYKRLENWGKVLENRTQQAERFPNNYASQHTLGEALWKNGKVDDALKAYQKAVELFPQDGSFGELNNIRHELGLLEDIKKGIRNLDGGYKGRPRF